MRCTQNSGAHLALRQNEPLKNALLEAKQSAITLPQLTVAVAGCLVGILTSVGSACALGGDDPLPAATTVIPGGKSVTVTTVQELRSALQEIAAGTTVSDCARNLLPWGLSLQRLGFTGVSDRRDRRRSSESTHICRNERGSKTIMLCLCETKPSRLYRLLRQRSQH